MLPKVVYNTFFLFLPLMKFTAEQIASILEGVVDGNPNVEVSSPQKLEEGKEGTLSFLSNPKYTPFIYKTNASIVIVNQDFTPENEIKSTLIRVDDSYKSFSKLLEYYNQYKLSITGIESPISVDESSSYGTDCYIGAFTYIGKHVKIEIMWKFTPTHI